MTRTDRPPADLTDPELVAVWTDALAALQAAGTWSVEVRPLLDEYVFALAAARVARQSGFHSAHDRAARRAMAFADRLGLTPRTRRGASGRSRRPVMALAPRVA